MLGSAFYDYNFCLDILTLTCKWNHFEDRISVSIAAACLFFERLLQNEIVLNFYNYSICLIGRVYFADQ